MKPKSLNLNNILVCELLHMPTCIAVMLIAYASVIIVSSCILSPSCHEPAGVIFFSFAYFYFIQMQAC